MKKIIITFICVSFLFNINAQTFNYCDSTYQLHITNQTSTEATVTLNNINLNSNYFYTFFDNQGNCIGGTTVSQSPENICVLGQSILDTTILWLSINDSTLGFSCFVVDTLVFNNSYWQLSSSSLTCIDSALIDTMAICFFIYDPVCGCDGITYSNDCIAENYGGVTSWTQGVCPSAYGCTDTNACNFNPNATIDDSSCIYHISVQNTISICDGDSVIVADGYTGVISNIYYSAGNYIDTLSSYTGCDSILTTNIVLNTNILAGPISGGFIQGTNLIGSPTLFYGSFLNEIGVNDSIMWSVFCGTDTIHSEAWGYNDYVNAATIHPITGIDTISIFEYEFSQPSCGCSLPPALTNEYYVIMTVIEECADTNVSPPKLVIPTQINVMTQNTISICDGDSVIVADGYTGVISNIYYSAGNYIDTLSSYTGCDSILYTDILVDDNTESYDTITSFNPLLWNGNYLTVSGDYVDTLINISGCDSIAYLNLNITPTAVNELSGPQRKPVKITNILGKEVPYRKNTPLFFIYSDGTVEKRIVIEK